MSEHSQQNNFLLPRLQAPLYICVNENFTLILTSIQYDVIYCGSYGIRGISMTYRYHNKLLESIISVVIECEQFDYLIV